MVGLSPTSEEFFLLYTYHIDLELTSASSQDTTTTPYSFFLLLLVLSSVLSNLRGQNQGACATGRIHDAIISSIGVYDVVNECQIYWISAEVLS